MGCLPHRFPHRLTPPAWALCDRARCRRPPRRSSVNGWRFHVKWHWKIWCHVQNLPKWWFYRRKFRSQTSDNMDRWKAEQGRGREKRKIRRKKIRRERVRRKKMQMREKVGKSRNTVFFQWFVAPEGRKVGSLKRRVRSQLARWEMKIARRCGAKHISKSKCTKHLGLGALLEVGMSKKCTPLWREAHLQVKMYKTHQRSDHFWKLRCRKSARRCGAKHISKSKCTKHTSSGPLLEVKMSKKCTPLWRKAHVEVKMYKAHHVRTTFGGRFAWQAQGIVDLVKSEQNVLTWGFWCVL